MSSVSLNDTISETKVLTNFPDENPNPVMRLSSKGRLLYANRASQLLLQNWNQQVGDSISGDGMSMLYEAIESGIQKQEDFDCGDKVFTVVFAPVAGSDYVNLYALDTTGKKKVELALQTALDEVRVLKNRLQQENHYLQDEIKQVHGADAIIGNSKVQEKLLQKVRQVAKTDTTVLISGETGTGKELLARAIHAASQRKDRPLVKINCATLPVGLIENELFGHEKGAFTGATARKTGRFELADGGTIFLDEIGDLPLVAQGNLLRVLQEGEIRRVGESFARRVDVRVITATHRDLSQRVASGEFREDLLYRLQVLVIQLPPLRERPTDIEPLVQHFLERIAGQRGQKKVAIRNDAMELFERYSWPGNVRQLENRIKKAVIMSDRALLNADDLQISAEDKRHIRPLAEAEEEFKVSYIREVLELNNWNKAQTARDLGVDPRTIFRYIEKFED